MAFRKLRSGEIDVRVASVTEKGCSLLLYKDARVDQNILDESLGMYNWQRSHQLIGDRLYCTVSVKNPETGEWISKQDVGTESFTEPEKGQASDSFKRACFNLGIGRELYSAPFIWIGADKCSIKAGKNGRPAVYDRFAVKEISYTDSGTICKLIIVNQSMKDSPEVFTFGTINTNTDDKIDEKKIATIKKVIEGHKMPELVILSRYKKQSLGELTMADWNDFAKNGETLLKQWDERVKDEKK